jgi:acetolactate synthase small subunit
VSLSFNQDSVVKFESQDHAISRTNLKLDDSSKEARINSIIRIAKDLRPIGKVVAIIESPIRHAKLIVTLKLIDEELVNPNQLAKLNKRQ